MRDFDNHISSRLRALQIALTTLKAEVETLHGQNKPYEISEEMAEKIVRAYWRRIFKFQENAELPEPLPTLHLASMLTALSWLPKLYTHPPQVLNEELIKEAVNRFLAWQLPENFSPDGAIKFDRNVNKVFQYSQPNGTNLFTADQAKAMFEYCLGTKDK